MTERLLRLPSDEYREMKEKLEAKIIKQEAKYEAKLSKQKAENAKLAAEIQRLKEQLRMAGTN